MFSYGGTEQLKAVAWGLRQWSVAAAILDQPISRVRPIARLCRLARMRGAAPVRTSQASPQ